MKENGRSRTLIFAMKAGLEKPKEKAGSLFPPFMRRQRRRNYNLPTVNIMHVHPRNRNLQR
jgi:hypothetical protein